MWLSLFGVVGVVGSIWRTATAAWHVQHLFWHLSSLLCPFCFPQKKFTSQYRSGDFFTHKWTHTVRFPHTFPIIPVPLSFSPCFATFAKQTHKSLRFTRQILISPPSTNYEVKTSRQSASRQIEQVGKTRSDKDPAFKQNSIRVSIRRLRNQNNQVGAVWIDAHGHRRSVQRNAHERADGHPPQRFWPIPKREGRGVDCVFTLFAKKRKR